MRVNLVIQVVFTKYETEETELHFMIIDQYDVPPYIILICHF